MSDDARWDGEMRAVRRRMDEMAAAHPPVRLADPYEAAREANDRLTLPWAEGGPIPAVTEDRWVAARGRRVFCRAHRPEGGPATVLIWFHGGGWVWSSVDTHDRLVREYVVGGGVAAVSVDYALAPEAAFPRAALEGASVTGRIAADLAAWGGGTRFLIGGDSAGGNLALATTLLLRAQGGPMPAGLLLCYPVCAAEFETPSYREFADGYGLTREGMRTYWDLYAPAAADRLNPVAAPLLADFAGFPPTLIQLAELDVLRSEGESLAARMQAAGVDARLEVCPGVAHGFMRLTGHVARARETVASACAWLRGFA